jgi:hypothetical protein
MQPEEVRQLAPMDYKGLRSDRRHARLRFSPVETECRTRFG